MSKQDKEQLRLMKEDQDAAVAGETETLARIAAINESTMDAMRDIRQLQEIVTANNLRVAHLITLRSIAIKTAEIKRAGEKGGGE